jgi:hypothetical protein
MHRFLFTVHASLAIRSWRHHWLLATAAGGCGCGGWRLLAAGGWRLWLWLWLRLATYHI